MIIIPVSVSQDAAYLYLSFMEISRMECCIVNLISFRQFLFYIKKNQLWRARQFESPGEP